MIFNIKLFAASIITTGFLIACFPSSSDDGNDTPEGEILNPIPSSSMGDPNLSSTIPGLSTIPGVSSVGSSSAGVSSQIEVSSSSVVFVPKCNRRPTSLEFRFVTGNVMVAGWQSGTYPAGGLSDGTLIVPEGDPCEEAQAVAPAMVGDDWNIFLQQPWQGRSGERLKLDVITWTSEPSSNTSSAVNTSSQSAVIPGAVAGWLTEEIYNKAFPNRNSFYTWASFVEAFDELQKFSSQGDFRFFLQEGSLDQKKREAAAFFANIIQETGTQNWNSGLYHIVETCAASGTPEGRCVGYGSSSPNYYFGRGPMQLSWNYNYEAFSLAAFNNVTTLLFDPNRVSEDPKVAWLAAMWFWNRVDTSYISNPPPTIHDIMVNGLSFGGYGGFGGTIKVINGGLECSSPNHPKALYRVHYYKQMLNLLGMPEEVSGLNCA